jgi:chromate transporter
MKKSAKIFWHIFISTLYISAFTFGGGFAIMPMLKKRFVDELKLIDEKDMLDYMAVAQTSPGVIAVNTSVLIGYKVAGAMGALAAVLGTILPPFVITAIISVLYEAFIQNQIVAAALKCMQAAVAAVIVNVAVNLAGNILKKREVFPILIAMAAFIAVYFFDISILLILLCAAVLGIINYFVFLKINNAAKSGGKGGEGNDA